MYACTMAKFNDIDLNSNRTRVIVHNMTEAQALFNKLGKNWRWYNTTIRLPELPNGYDEGYFFNGAPQCIFTIYPYRPDSNELGIIEIYARQTDSYVEDQSFVMDLSRLKSQGLANGSSAIGVNNLALRWFKNPEQVVESFGAARKQ